MASQSFEDLRVYQLVRHVRYRWDELRGQHQLVYPEGMLVLNDTGAAIVRLCNGRSLDELLAALTEECGDSPPREDVCEFLQRLAQKKLLMTNDYGLMTND
jgi:pyrroloquinoline quinone biosynthesis protein D